MPPQRPSRGAEAFDAFRRELMRQRLPVQKDQRKEWEERFRQIVEAAAPPEKRKLFQKPGLAARMFAAEIELPDSHPRDLAVYAEQLDLVWEAKLPKDAAGWRTLTTADRTDLVWEFALDLGTAYVTGAVKLRNYPFERPKPREERTFDRGRPQRRDDRDRGRPPRRDDRDGRSGPGDRPPRRDGYGSRGPKREGYGRPGPKRPYRKRDDR